MKKFLAILFCLMAMTVMAQRPVQPRTNAGSNNTSVTINKTGVDRVATSKKAYSYTISLMEMPNVTVMDANASVAQEGKTDKLKVTVTGNNEGINYYIYDANNQAISKNYFKTVSTSIDMSSFQPGEYRIQLLNKKGAEKNFRIIKKQK